MLHQFRRMNELKYEILCHITKYMIPPSTNIELEMDQQESKDLKLR